MGGCSSRNLLGRDWTGAEEPAGAPKKTREELMDTSPDPKVLMAESILAGVQTSQEDLREAERMMDTCISQFPSHARAYLVRGRVRFARQQWPEAVNDLTAAITRQPDFGQAFYVRSQAYVKMGQLENAIQDYKRALMVDPDNSQLAALKAQISQAHTAAAATLAACPAPDAPATASRDQEQPRRRASGGGLAGPGDGKKGLTCAKPALPPLRVNAGEAESEDPFAAVDTPQDVAAATGKLCMVCMDAPRNCRLRPCMHAALCTECAQGLMRRCYGCPICDSRIDSLERGTFMCTFTADSANQALAKSIKEAAALRRLAAAGTATDSQATSPTVSPSLLHPRGSLHQGTATSASSSPPLYGLSPSLTPHTPSVLSSIFSPSSSHYTPPSRPTTTLTTVAEVQETPYLARNSTRGSEGTFPPSPLGHLSLTPQPQPASPRDSTASPQLTHTPASQPQLEHPPANGAPLPAQQRQHRQQRQGQQQGRGGPSALLSTQEVRAVLQPEELPSALLGAEEGSPEWQRPRQGEQLHDGQQEERHEQEQGLGEQQEEQHMREQGQGGRQEEEHGQEQGQEGQHQREQGQEEQHPGERSVSAQQQGGQQGNQEEVPVPQAHLERHHGGRPHEQRQPRLPEQDQQGRGRSQEQRQGEQQTHQRQGEQRQGEQQTLQQQGEQQQGEQQTLQQEGEQQQGEQQTLQQEGEQQQGEQQTLQRQGEQQQGQQEGQEEQVAHEQQQLEHHSRPGSSGSAAAPPATHSIAPARRGSSRCSRRAGEALPAEAVPSGQDSRSGSAGAPE